MPKRRDPDEINTVEAIIHMIIERGGWAHKVHGTEFNAAEPDVDGCLDGVAIKIEVKKPGKEPRKDQRFNLHRWKRAGAAAGCAHSLDEAEDIIDDTKEWIP
jgi:hypothetical protein